MLVNYVLYQAGWFACVLGGASGYPWTGFAVAMALMLTHLVRAPDKAGECRLAVIAVIVGLGVESYQIWAGTYRVRSGTLLVGLPPLWLLAMWAQFATTFRFSLRYIMTRPTRAALFGAAGGPIACLAGERLGAVVLLPPVSLGLLRLAIAWGLALTVLSVVTRGEMPDGEGRR